MSEMGIQIPISRIQKRFAVNDCNYVAPENTFGPHARVLYQILIPTNAYYIINDVISNGKLR